MKTSRIFSVICLIISANAFAQENAQPNLSRDRNLPPPEWNIQADPLHKGESSAKDILGRAAKVYAKLETYQDRTHTLRTNDGQNIYTRSESSTRFDKASHKFRFEAWSLDASGARRFGHVVAMDQNQVKVWSEANNRVDAESSIASALSRAAYISDEVPFDIPATLIPGVVAASSLWTSSANKYRISDVTENNISYFRVQGMTIRAYGALNETNVKTTYWIRKEDALLGRIVREMSDVDLHFRSYIRTDYEPIINQPIPESEFEFGH